MHPIDEKLGVRSGIYQVQVLDGFGVVRPQAARTEGSKNLGGEVGDLLCDGRSYVADGRRGSL